MSIRWLIPTVDPVWFAACWASLHLGVHTRTQVVDNQQFNAGVAVSWNVGIKVAEEAGDEWLVLCSEAMRFGAVGGRDLEMVLTPPWTDFGFAWHLIAFHMDTIHAVGRFDEAFWPAYMEDADYERRLELAGYPSPRGLGRTRAPLLGLDIHEAGQGHSIAEGLVQSNLGVAVARYATKWGGPKGAETYTTPYGNPDLTIRDVTIGEEARRAPPD